jgi:hypothetical protein
MKNSLIIILFFSLNLQGQVTMERFTVYNNHPDFIEVVKTFRNDSLVSIDAIYTSLDARPATWVQYETFYKGDAKEFYSWLVDLESNFTNKTGTMKMVHGIEVHVREELGLYLAIYKKDESCYALLRLKVLKSLRTTFYNWCVKNKINLSE